MALPDTYKQVEYIKSSGTQRIDTGINVSNDITYGFECKMGFEQISQGTACIMDMGNTSTDNNRYGISYYYNTSASTGSWQFGYTNPSSPYWGVDISGYGPTPSTDFTLSYNLNGDKAGKINGTSVLTGMSISNISYANNWNIFCQTYSSTYTRYGTFKLYYMKIYHGSTLVRDFVPAIRKSDNKPGLYDLVNDVFYTNQGTGEFEYPAQFGKITHIYLGTDLIRPKKQSGDFYYSDDNWNEYQSLVSSVGSVQFVDTGKRYRFQNGCYIGNRTAVNVDGTTFKKVNLDTLTEISSKSSTVNGRLFYFGDNRILTKDGIMDFDGNIITSFSSYSFRGITVGLPGEVWGLDNSYGMYKGVVNGDNVTFTKVGTSTSNSGIGASPGNIVYGRLGTYTLGYTENSTQYLGFYNASTGTFSTMTVAAGQTHMSGDGQVMPDGKIYKHVQRNLGWGKLYKIGTAGEGAVGSQLSTSRTSYGLRYGKFLGNVVSGGMSSQNGTGNGYGSNNYFINSSGTVTLVQSNAFAYDTSIYSSGGFVDENGWIYPYTSGGGSGVILKTDKTFTDFPWWNPYLYR